jgi:hypothetical protein
MSAVIVAIGQSVESAELRITNDELWLEAFQAKLKKDERPVEVLATRRTRPSGIS